jgi:hypothetical protein
MKITLSRAGKGNRHYKPHSAIAQSRIAGLSRMRGFFKTKALKLQHTARRGRIVVSHCWFVSGRSWVQISTTVPPLLTNFLVFFSVPSPKLHNNASNRARNTSFPIILNSSFITHPIIGLDSLLSTASLNKPCKVHAV